MPSTSPVDNFGYFMSVCVRLSVAVCVWAHCQHEQRTTTSSLLRVLDVLDVLDVLVVVYIHQILVVWICDCVGVFVCARLHVSVWRVRACVGASIASRLKQRRAPLTCRRDVNISCVDAGFGVSCEWPRCLCRGVLG